MEHALPEGVAQHGDGGTFGDVLGAREFPPELRVHAKRAKEAGGDARLLNIFEVAVRREIGAAFSAVSGSIERRGQIADGFEHGGALAGVGAFRAVQPPGGDGHRETVRLGVGGGTEQHGIQHAVNGGIGADTKAQCGQHGQREARALAKLAKGESDVVHSSSVQQITDLPSQKPLRRVAQMKPIRWRLP